MKDVCFYLKGGIQILARHTAVIFHIVGDSGDVVWGLLFSFPVKVLLIVGGFLLT
jgi:hypothetical protein